MKTTYYPEDDILEIHLNEKPVAREISYGWNLNISYAVDGSIREIVILEAQARGLYPISTERQAAWDAVTLRFWGLAPTSSIEERIHVLLPRALPWAGMLRPFRADFAFAYRVQGTGW